VELGIATSAVATSDGVRIALLAIAETRVDDMVRLHLHREVHKGLQSALTLHVGGGGQTLSASFASAARRTAEQVEAMTKGELREVRLRSREADLRRLHKQHIADGTWTLHFRGRDILQKFVPTYSTLRYEDFRNLIVARMKDSGHKPSGMMNTLQDCLAT
jgi:hypothetical protein